MEKDASIDAIQRRFIGSELRNQHSPLFVCRPGSRQPISLRKAKADFRNPRAARIRSPSRRRTHHIQRHRVAFARQTGSIKTVFCPERSVLFDIWISGEKFLLVDSACQLDERLYLAGIVQLRTACRSIGSNSAKLAW